MIRATATSSPSSPHRRHHHHISRIHSRLAHPTEGTRSSTWSTMSVLPPCCQHADHSRIITSSLCRSSSTPRSRGRFRADALKIVQRLVHEFPFRIASFMVGRPGLFIAPADSDSTSCGQAWDWVYGQGALELDAGRAGSCTSVRSGSRGSTRLMHLDRRDARHMLDSARLS